MVKSGSKVLNKPFWKSSKPLNTDNMSTNAITSTPTPIIEMREIKVIKLALNGEKKYLFATNKEILIF
jgi:hypothetical protein